MPPDAAVRPPVNAPGRPHSSTAFCTPCANKCPNPQQRHTGPGPGELGQRLVHARRRLRLRPPRRSPVRIAGRGELGVINKQLADDADCAADHERPDVAHTRHLPARRSGRCRGWSRPAKRWSGSSARRWHENSTRLAAAPSASIGAGSSRRTARRHCTRPRCRPPARSGCSRHTTEQPQSVVVGQGQRPLWPSARIAEVAVPTWPRSPVKMASKSCRSLSPVAVKIAQQRARRPRASWRRPCC